MFTSQTETKQFKRWFGDSEVVDSDGNPMQKDETGDFYTKGVEYFKSIGGSAVNPTLGEISLNEKGIRHLINRRLTWRKTALLPAVKAVIENGYVIMTDENHKGNRFDTAIVAGVVEWNGKQFYMGVALRQDEGIKNSYYFHDAVFVEKRRLTDSTQDAGGGKNASIVREGADEPSIAIILSELADYNTEFQEKFSLRDPVETNGELVAVHNIKENDLLGTLRLGGFPMPSIAIIKGKDGHTMYGDYSVVFGKEAIDPQADKANKVYGADAWTPTFPPVETEIKHDVMYNVQKEMGSLAGQVDSEYAQKAESWFGNFGGLDTTDKTMADIQDSAWNNSGMVAAYLADHGESVDILEKDVPVKRDYNTARASMYDKVLDIVPLNDIESMKARELLDTYGDQLAESIPHPFARLNTLWKDKDYDAGKRMLDFLRQAKSYENSGRDTSVQTEKVKDFDATYTAMKESIDRNDFNAWVTQKVQGAFGAQGIYNGKERFTPSGNRRSFKSLHNDLTADNVVKSMLTQEESYIPPTDAKGLMAAASSMYKSIAEIKADESRLGKISGEEYIAKIAGADNMYHDFLNAIEAWDATEIEDVGELLVKAAKQRMNASAISTLFKRNGYSKATLNAAKMAKQLIDTVQNIPTGYFEAKPQRVVDFNEVRMVIAPDTMGAELENVLEELGIPYMTYAANDEADRLAKLNGLEDVKFSPRENDHLLNGSEYRRLQSEWSNYKYRGYKYTKSQYGGIVVDFDNKLVYTDRNGNPMRTLTVVTDDRWLNNDIIEAATDFEKEGIDYETQQGILERLFPKGSFAFTDNKNGEGITRSYSGRRKGGSYNGQVRKGNRTDLSDAETSVYDESRVKKYSLRDQTETKQFKRWFGDSEVVDSDGNPKIVYHATDAAFTVFDRDKLGGDSHTVWIPFTSEQIKDASPVTYDDAGKVIPLSKRFDQTQQDIRYSPRENDHLLSKSEYARFMSNWNSQKYGNQFEPRPNGGKMIVMDNIIVYTDHTGNVERVLEVTTGDIWKLNDIQQQMMLIEESGEDYEVQRTVLQSVYGEESAHFRTKGERTQTSGKNRKGTGRNARSVGKGDSEEVSSQKARGTLGVLNSEDKYSLRPQTDTPEFQRWFKDSEVVDSDGNPKIVYHATDAAFTVFDRDKLGSDSHTVWIPFTSEQIKDASPVTYDDAGKVIPLSERFDTTQQDIRYSVRETDQLDEGKRNVFVEYRPHI